MRKLAIAVALSTTVLAGPALARDGAWYVGGDFGAMIVEDTELNFTPGNTAGSTGQTSIGFDPGFDGSVFVGYDLGAFRIEAEGSYKKADVEEVITGDLRLPGAGPATGSGFLAGSGDVNILSFMVNGLLDFGDDDGLSGFVGGGVGIGRAEFNGIGAFANTPTVIDDSDTRFAWQVVAGVRQALTPNIDVHLKYRLFNLDDLETVGFGGRNVDGDLRTHSLVGGITFNFGAPEPAPVCLAPNFLNEAGICVAPAPVVQPVVCGPNQRLDPVTNTCVAIPVEPRFIDCPGGTRVPEGQQCPVVQIAPSIVYFGWDESTLTDRARQTLQEAANVYRQGGQSQIVLAGHADRSGPAGYNVGLSQRRANAVRDYLTSLGVPAGALTTQAFGESRPAVETGDGVREPDNRRVEITFGPGSGW